MSNTVITIPKVNYPTQDNIWGPMTIPTGLVSLEVYLDTPASGPFIWQSPSQTISLQVKLLQPDGSWYDYGATGIGYPGPPPKGPHKFEFSMGVIPSSLQYEVHLTIDGGPITLSGAVTLFYS